MTICIVIKVSLQRDIVTVESQRLDLEEQRNPVNMKLYFVREELVYIENHKNIKYYDPHHAPQ